MLKQLLKKTVIFILTLEAWLVLKKYRPKIVAITGSVGKTATKDAICTVLGKRFFVQCSEKSFNSEIGVPLTILGCSSGWSNPIAWLKIFFEGLALIFLKNHYPSWLVLEVGTDRPGDIKSITRWLKPDIVVVTRFGEIPVHVEFFKSREDLIREKTNLVYALKKDGILVLNADDPDVYRLKDKAKQTTTLISFGFSEEAVVRASNVEIFYNEDKTPRGVQCKVRYKGNLFPLRIYGTIGKQYMSIALAALAVGVGSDINIINLLEYLADFKIPPGRLKTLPGINQSILIDDSYNSSPVAVEITLDSLQELETRGRKIVVLGDMLELGRASADEHRKVGALAASVCDVFITVGMRAQLMREEALKGGAEVRFEHIYHFENSVQAGDFLRSFVKENDVLLIKGSQLIRMERIVERLLAHPEKKRELLVRQEEEWQER